jgi:hypothetical protein
VDPDRRATCFTTDMAAWSPGNWIASPSGNGSQDSLVTLISLEPGRMGQVKTYAQERAGADPARLARVRGMSSSCVPK